ncbi:MAG TPA: hypothetical protein VGQ28_02010 [Thermoanaerobaculia bacterium]|nr:hypothetical protein [Thermoanaerobaculia bacterium]
MSRKSLGRKAALLVLGAALVAPWSAMAAGRSRAEPRRERTAPAAPQGVIALLWGTLTRVWEEEGCSLDPSGLTGACHQGHPLVGPANNGCSIDPNGASCSRATNPTGAARVNG